jgi:4-hydroxy-4-methyl-2-oxoglutarate aldolase
MAHPVMAHPVMAHIVTAIERPDAAVLEAVAALTPATLHEAQGRIGAIDSRIKPIYPGMRLCGPAVTVQCHAGDNLMLIAAIEVAQPGDVLVVAAGGRERQGGFGEVLATACRARGIQALVIDAGVRDGSALRAMGFPVFCPGLCVEGTVKETLGTVNRPIVVGGVHVRPGDVVNGDDDGVVVVRREEVAQVVCASVAREAKEAEVMRLLRAGGSIRELSGMGEVLRRKGCVTA